MIEFHNAGEFLRFERKWKTVFTCFALILVGALLDHMLRAPHGEEAVWCYSIGGLAFIICAWAANRLRNAARHDGLIDGLGLIEEDLSVGDFPD